MAAPKSNVKKKVLSIRLIEAERKEIATAARAERLSINEYMIRVALRDARNNGHSVRA